MAAEVIPLEVFHEFVRRKPNARVTALMRKIRREQLHFALWLWWLERAIAQAALEAVVEDENGRAA